MRNILFCGNSGVFDGILTCTLSILRRTVTEEPFAFYLFTMDLTRMKESYTPITEAQRAVLLETVTAYNPQSRVHLIDVTGLYERELAHCPNEGAYCSPYTLIRLLADLVPEMPEKLLYLDADLMFNRDIQLLYDINIETVEYAAARDHYGKYILHPDYINAGVLLFNMTVMKKTGILARARELLRKKKLVFADQSALIRATTKRRMLPQKFNDQKFLHKSTVVRHFSKRLFWLPYPHTDNIKQWQVDRVHQAFGYTQFDDIYKEYLAVKAAHKEI